MEVKEEMEEVVENEEETSGRPAFLRRLCPVSSDQSVRIGEGPLSVSEVTTVKAA
jgi:hypothetical protein